MTDRQIISLLKRYMEGSTTVEEETALAEFFGRATDDDRPNDISADDWRTYKEMFGIFASETVAKDQQEKAADDAKQRFTLRKLPDNTQYVQPLAQQTGMFMLADSIADSISAEQPQRVVADSVKQQPEKQRMRKALRPYWQPRPPKVYVADADKDATMPADSADIEKAVRQADILLHAINANQSAEIGQLELQALEMFEADEYDADESEAEDTGNGITQ